LIKTNFANPAHAGPPARRCQKACGPPQRRHPQDPCQGAGFPGAVGFTASPATASRHRRAPAQFGWGM